MSIKTYPKHQYCVELENSYTNMLYFIPSYSGYLKYMRVKMLKRNAVGKLGSAYLVVSSNPTGDAGNLQTISTSERVYYEDITDAPNSTSYYHSFVRFDFPENTIVAGKQYSIRVFQEDYVIENDKFVGYCLDYNYPVNETSKTNLPFSNLRLAAEIYLLKDYYDFD